MTFNTLLLNADDYALAKAVDFLNEGNVVALPSETVYGLAARADSEDGIKRIFSVKNRPADNPLILHCDSSDMAIKYLLQHDERFFNLAKAFWPGPLTIVAKRSLLVNDFVTAGQDTVAVRVPANDFFRSVINGCGVPIAAPSANISGRPSPTDAQEVYNQLNGSIPLIADGGSCSVGVESTIVLLSDSGATLLRPGDIGVEDLETVLNEPINRNTKDAPTAPGMKYRHYAPTSEVILYCGDSLANYLKDKSGTFGVVCYEEEYKDITAAQCLVLGRSTDEKQQQRRLFKILNSLDSYQLKRWYIHTDKNFEAIYNRLYKASEGKVADI